MYSGVTFSQVFVVSFSKLLFLCFVVALCDLVHDVESTHGLCQLHLEIFSEMWVMLGKLGTENLF